MRIYQSYKLQCVYAKKKYLMEDLKADYKEWLGSSKNHPGHCGFKQYVKENFIIRERKLK